MFKRQLPGISGRRNVAWLGDYFRTLLVEQVSCGVLGDIDVIVVPLRLGHGAM